MGGIEGGGDVGSGGEGGGKSGDGAGGGATATSAGTPLLTMGTVGEASTCKPSACESSMVLELAKLRAACSTCALICALMRPSTPLLGMVIRVATWTLAEVTASSSRQPGAWHAKRRWSVATRFVRCGEPSA
jgi:hypothetical protein